MRWEDDTDTLKINVQVNFKWTTRATRMVERRVWDRRIESSWPTAASSSSSTKNKKLRIEKRKKETRAEEKNVPTVSKSSIVHFHYYCTLRYFFSQIINFVLFFPLSFSLARTDAAAISPSSVCGVDALGLSSVISSWMLYMLRKARELRSFVWPAMAFLANSFQFSVRLLMLFIYIFRNRTFYASFASLDSVQSTSSYFFSRHVCAKFFLGEKHVSSSCCCYFAYLLWFS